MYLGEGRKARSVDRQLEGSRFGSCLHNPRYFFQCEEGQKMLLNGGSRELPNALFRPTVGLELNSSRICSRDLTCARAIRGSRLLKRFCGGTCGIEQILRGRTATGQSGSPPVVVPWTSSATVWARFLLPSADELRYQTLPRPRRLDRRPY